MNINYDDLVGNIIIMRKIRSRIWKVIGDNFRDLSVTDLIIFNKICSEEGPFSMSDLSRLTGFSNAILTSSVDALEKKSLVNREKGTDRRVNFIIATDNGKRRWDEISRYKKSVVESIFGNMSREDQATFSRLLKELRKLMEKYPF